MQSLLSKLAVPMLALSLQSQLLQGKTLADQDILRIHAKIVDWRGHPAVGSTVSLTVIRRDQNVTTTLYRKEFRATASDGSIDMEGPPGIWQFNVFRMSIRRGHPSIERNVPKRQGVTEFLITTPSTLAEPLRFRLGLAEWNVNTGTATWWLDMTTCTQGQTFRMEETRSIPLR